ncbi:MAG: tRNA-dihydrouridine synthase [Patescibacteria group bacterium]
MKYAGFWDVVPEICSVLAPMAEITDMVFRRLVAKYGKPDVIYTEFVSADGLMSQGRDVLLRDLRFHNSEHPIVAQIFGSNPEICARATEYIVTLGFDGVEINMGCPDKAVMKQGAGAALIDDPSRAIRIIQEMKRAAGSIPVSVKTRIGTRSDVLDEWILRLIDAQPAAIIVHGRTAKELSLVPARWERIGYAAKLAEGTGIRVIGNGDILSLDEGYRVSRANGARGFMVGRAAIGNPFFFSGRNDVTLAERLAVMREHACLFKELMPWKPFVHVRKHLAKYAAGFKGIKELRMELTRANNPEDVARATEVFLEKQNKNNL